MFEKFISDEGVVENPEHIKVIETQYLLDHGRGVLTNFALDKCKQDPRKIIVAVDGKINTDWCLYDYLTLYEKWKTFPDSKYNSVVWTILICVTFLGLLIFLGGDKLNFLSGEKRA